MFEKKKANEPSFASGSRESSSPQDSASAFAQPNSLRIEDALERMIKYNNHPSEIGLKAIWEDADFFEAHEAALRSLIQQPSLFADGDTLAQVMRGLVGRAFMAAMWHDDFSLIEKVKHYAKIVVPDLD